MSTRAIETMEAEEAGRVTIQDEPEDGMRRASKVDRWQTSDRETRNGETEKREGGLKGGK